MKVNASQALHSASLRRTLHVHKQDLLSVSSRGVAWVTLEPQVSYSCDLWDLTQLISARPWVKGQVYPLQNSCPPRSWECPALSPITLMRPPRCNHPLEKPSPGTRLLCSPKASHSLLQMPGLHIFPVSLFCFSSCYNLYLEINSSSVRLCSESIHVETWILCFLDISSVK